MLTKEIKFNTQSYVENVELKDSTLTGSTKLGKTGLVFNSPGLTAYYKRQGANASVQIALVAGSGIGAYTDSGAAGTGGGFKEVDATNMKGLYELSIPNAALVAGASWVHLCVVATGVAQFDMQYVLVGYDPSDPDFGIPQLGGTASGVNITVNTGGANNLLFDTRGWPGILRAHVASKYASGVYTPVATVGTDKNGNFLGNLGPVQPGQTYTVEFQNHYGVQTKNVTV